MFSQIGAFRTPLSCVAKSVGRESVRTKSIETKSVGRESVRTKSIETKSVWVKKKKKEVFLGRYVGTKSTWTT